MHRVQPAFGRRARQTYWPLSLLWLQSQRSTRARAPNFWAYSPLRAEPAPLVPHPMGASASTMSGKQAWQKPLSWVKKNPAAVVVLALVLGWLQQRLSKGKARRLALAQASGPFRVAGGGTAWANGVYVLEPPNMFDAPKYRQVNEDGSKGSGYIYRLRGGGEWAIVDRPGWAGEKGADKDLYYMDKRGCPAPPCTTWKTKDVDRLPPPKVSFAG
eukprot:COSAG05_NODE_3375_length_2103_cov_7.128244_1_plen_215_part_00